MQDYYGRLIRPGVTVAFNYSGQVRIGVIKTISTRTVKRWSGDAISYTITVQHDTQESKVKGIRNLVVLPAYSY